MAVLSNFVSLVLFYLVLVGFAECEEDICKKTGPCRCVFSNGTGVDLGPTKLTSSTPLFYQTNDFRVEKNENNLTTVTLFTYYFSPCTDVAVKSTDTCNQSMSLYRDDLKFFELNDTKSNFHKTHLCEYLGDIQKLDFTADGKAIVYKNGPSQSTVMLVCSQGDTKLQMFENNDPNNIHLAFYSEHACLRQLEDPGRSFGSTLLIIFFSLIIFYLVLGVCTKKFLMGATGVEVIPNLSFWTDLPNLVKDGWAFLISGFKLPPRGVGPTASDPNSYDSI